MDIIIQDVITIPGYVVSILSTAWIIVKYIWWIPIPFIVIPVFARTWLYFIRKHWVSNLEWVMLEIIPPRNIERSPKIMEQAVTGFWGAFGTISTKADEYISGIIQEWYSLEIVGLNGKLHFFVRTLKHFRDLVEAKIYAQYPDAEIHEVEDYMNYVPFDFEKQGYDLWATVMRRTGPGELYPIRTYPYFEDPIDRSFIDPLASLAEVVNRMHEGEQMWLQILIQPEDEVKKLELVPEAVDKFVGRPGPAKKKSLITQEVQGWLAASKSVGLELITGEPYEIEVPAEEEKPRLPRTISELLTQGEQADLLALESKAGKRWFQCRIQYGYYARKEVFLKPRGISAVMGALAQTAGITGFKPWAKEYTVKAYYVFTAWRKRFKKRKLLRMLRERAMYPWYPRYILNSEEIATLWHFPMPTAVSPAIERIETKRGGAPSTLPVEPRG